MEKCSIYVTTVYQYESSIIRGWEMKLWFAIQFFVILSRCGILGYIFNRSLCKANWLNMLQSWFFGNIIKHNFKNDPIKWKLSLVFPQYYHFVTCNLHQRWIPPIQIDCWTTHFIILICLHPWCHVNRKFSLEQQTIYWR